MRECSAELPASRRSQASRTRGRERRPTRGRHRARPGEHPDRSSESNRSRWWARDPSPFGAWLRRSRATENRRERCPTRTVGRATRGANGGEGTLVVRVAHLPNPSRPGSRTEVKVRDHPRSIIETGGKLGGTIANL